jgi:cytosine/adenosine deaminase-related metal-dependent hydrolase
VEQVDLLLDDGYVVTVDADRRMIAHGSIAVRDGEIVACGEAAEVRRTVTATRTIDCAGKLVLPGFVDAHNHPIHFLSQGFSDDAPLYWRIANRIRPMERIISADDAYRGAKGNFATMLLNAQWDSTVNQGPHIDWLRQYWRSLEPHTRGFYTNDAIEESQQQIDDNYAANLPRLVALKNRYDSTNLFRLNANIVPTV